MTLLGMIQLSGLVAKTLTGDLEHEQNLRDVFTNVEVLLRIYLILSNDEHRATINQNRLVHLTMLSTEWDVMRRINRDLSVAKTRKLFISVCESSKDLTIHIFTSLEPLVTNLVEIFECHSLYDQDNLCTLCFYAALSCIVFQYITMRCSFPVYHHAL